MSVLLTPHGSELRLPASLAAWTWPGTRPDGREIAHILITHTPALTGSGTAETAEARMRRLSTRRPWTEQVARSGEAILLLGPDPLPQSAR
ncbi:hypothetical protein RCO28_32900 [Streptomyces sp. LHD-70]|uniref:hypothetical protein n=1 Tax=Streptomyces sp. LHD-70 TaxID=3072140 RepID=UPI00280EBA15|nr:hypothetical protein [Streptomyces sp. LHD-70]MDQ8707231.1 hypothetical protein [Streptomyces sp. LHD-70]